MGEQLIFYALGGLILFCSTMVILARNPVTSAMFLIADLFMFACLYAFLGAHFVATIQILVYAGAIMVLFMFVIMLLNLRVSDLQGPKLPPIELVAVLLSILGLFTTAFILMGSGDSTSSPQVESMLPGSELEQLGIRLFTKYLWPFELASFLILLAIIAAVVIAKKDKPDAVTTKSTIRGGS